MAFAGPRTHLRQQDGGVRLGRKTCGCLPAGELSNAGGVTEVFTTGWFPAFTWRTAFALVVGFNAPTLFA